MAVKAEDPADAVDLLRQYLKKTKLTQAALARKAGITEAQVSRLLSKKRRPSNDTAHAIAEATGGEVPAKAWVSRPFPKAA
jgi:transcriptional regulator with XRE-family HTH domain